MNKREVVNKGLKAVSQVLVALMCINKSMAAEFVSFGIYQDQLDIINEFVDANGCPPLTEANYGNNQVLAEYVILCNAFKSAEEEILIRLSPYPVNRRVIEALEAKQITATAMGVWSFDVDSTPDIELSEPLLKKGDFVKGLYTTKEKAQYLSIADNIKKSTGLLNQNWEHDWKSLACFDVRLQHVSRYGQMFGMLARERGDFIPLAFGTGAEFKREEFGVVLYPISGYKIAFPFTLSFAVNTSTKFGKKLLTELNKGLRRLRHKQEISKTYQRLGITNSAFVSWKNISC